MPNIFHQIIANSTRLNWSLRKMSRTVQRYGFSSHPWRLRNACYCVARPSQCHGAKCNAGVSTSTRVTLIAARVHTGTHVRVSSTYWHGLCPERDSALPFMNGEVTRRFTIFLDNLIDDEFLPAFPFRQRYTDWYFLYISLFIFNCFPFGDRCLDKRTGGSLVSWFVKIIEWRGKIFVQVMYTEIS